MTPLPQRNKNKNGHELWSTGTEGKSMPLINHHEDQNLEIQALGPWTIAGDFSGISVGVRLTMDAQEVQDHYG